MGTRRVEHVMGMPVSIDVRDVRPDDAAVDAAFAWLRRVDEVYSLYREESQLSRLNAGTLRLEDADADVREVLWRCHELKVRTDGYFDAYAAWAHAWSDRPGGGLRVDPSGLVKGWAVARAGAILADAGSVNHCINAAGDLHVRGEPAPGEAWRIGIQHPTSADRVAAVLDLRDVAIATSGAYLRGAHIVDPHGAGTPAGGVVSVTVVGPDLATADAYATAAFAMGDDGPAWTAGLEEGYAALSITADGRMLSTAGFDAHRAG